MKHKFIVLFCVPIVPVPELEDTVPVHYVLFTLYVVYFNVMYVELPLKTTWKLYLV